MESKPQLKRLLRPNQTATLLQGFAPLLGPDISLAVSGAPGHLLVSNRPFPPEIIRTLWKAVSDATDAAEVTITSQGAATPIYVGVQQIGMIMASGPLPLPDKTQNILIAVRYSLESIASATSEKRAVARDALDRYQEINLLYGMGETLATCLDVDELPQRALTEASQIVHARQGAVLLYNETGELVTVASTGPDGKLDTALAGKHTLILAEEVARTGKSQIINDFDPAGDGLDEKRQIPFMAAPLLTSERHLGVILLANKAGKAPAIFTAGDEKLLLALAWQAAIALDNARLFDDVRQQRDEISTMKHYMDNIFASIASGVITTDTNDHIVTFNQAAEAMLRVPAHQAINHSYLKALDFLRYTPLPSMIEKVRQHHSSNVAQEISFHLPQGEQLYLDLNVSRLLGNEGETLGVAIVVDDVTEKRNYERERALVRRYLPSGLVDWLPYDAELGLRHERRVITVIFADIRGFTSFSEVTPPERVMEVLNNYLTLAEAAVRFNWGIVDKYMGDAVMALFNTPLLKRQDHAWQAVQMAWTLKHAIEAYHQEIIPEERLFLGIGICSGEVVVGNVGTEDRMEYTAVGDTVNLAQRLQAGAKPGQILISHKTWELVQNRVNVNALPAIQLKGRQAFTRIYELTDLTKTD
ncbi:MAG: GAF domain-containing protein [Chloroflexi bacterium]|nr:GAF domain-containing protein [Chloroflexota bacterium]